MTRFPDNDAGAVESFVLLDGATHQLHVWGLQRVSIVEEDAIIVHAAPTKET